MINAFDFILDRRFLSSTGFFIQSQSVTSTQGASGTVEVFQENIYKNPVPVFQGATYQGNKTINLRIGKDTLFDEFEVDMIKSWLEGKLYYRPITFIQKDLNHLHMNVIITSVSTKYIGNQPAYLLLTMMCDSPFAWESEKEYSWSNSTTSFINTSSFGDYVYPVIEFGSTINNGSITIVNKSDNSRTFKYDNIGVNETITIDNNKKIVTSSLGRKVLQNFNKKWFRLLEGNNELSISGNSKNLKVKYSNARKVL